MIEIKEEKSNFFSVKPKKNKECRGNVSLNWFQEEKLIP